MSCFTLWQPPGADRLLWFQRVAPRCNRLPEPRSQAAPRLDWFQAGAQILVEQGVRLKSDRLRGGAPPGQHLRHSPAAPSSPASLLPSDLTDGGPIGPRPPV